MKHDLKITIYLVILFITAQVVGLFVVSQKIAPSFDEIGNIKLNNDGVIILEENLESEPPFSHTGNLLYLVFMVLFGTSLLFILNKFKLFSMWKLWFFLAISGSLFYALETFMMWQIAAVISIVAAYFKLFKSNMIIHNLTEIFIYGGIAVLMYKWFSVPIAILLLVVISIYDMIAVWQSKHMITLAKAQAENKMFAGLLIPYKSEKNSSAIKIKKENTDLKSSKISHSQIKMKIPKGFKEEKVSSAILGGGDIAFPLLFGATIMYNLFESMGPFQTQTALNLAKQNAFFMTLFVPIFSSVALFLLFVKSQKGKFYPAMPFITAGCLVGYAIIYFI